MRLKFCTFFAAVALTGGAAAQSSDPISTDAVYACATIADSEERLACYDLAVGRLQAAEEAGEITTISKTEVEEIQKDTFGLSIPRLSLPSFGNSSAEELESLEIPVTEITRRQYGELRITLENGQVWEQTDGTRIQYSQRVGVDSAVINRAALGSFKMKLDGGRAFRVKRIE